MTNPASSHRALTQRAQRNQPGEIVSFTTIHHPPAGFPKRARTVGLIALEDGSNVLGELIVPEGAEIAIGQSVLPRMRLNQVNDQGLRIYDIAYEISSDVPSNILQKEFPGYILALTGPSGVGKSTVSKMLTSVLSERAANVPILTTRKKKKGDDGEYQYISTEEFLELKKKGEIIAATQIPAKTEKRWYGYRAADIEAIWKEHKLPVVVTEKHLLQGLALHFGRRSILSFGLLPPGKSKRTMLSALVHRLRTRGLDTEAQMRDRIENAKKDLDFFKQSSHLFDDLIVNEDLDTVIETLKVPVLEHAKV